MGYKNVSEKEILEHVKHVRCRYISNCLLKDDLRACWPCTKNKNGPQRQDNYMERIKGMKFF